MISPAFGACAVLEPLFRLRRRGDCQGCTGQCGPPFHPPEKSHGNGRLNLFVPYCTPRSVGNNSVNLWFQTAGQDLLRRGHQPVRQPRWFRQAVPNRTVEDKLLARRQVYTVTDADIKRFYAVLRAQDGADDFPPVHEVHP